MVAATFKVDKNDVGVGQVAASELVEGVAFLPALRLQTRTGTVQLVFSTVDAMLDFVELAHFKALGATTPEFRRERDRARETGGPR